MHVLIDALVLALSYVLSWYCYVRLGVMNNHPERGILPPATYMTVSYTHLDVYKRQLPGKIRILIEGACSAEHKNVDESFRIVEQLDLEKFEIWYMSYNGNPKSWYRVDRFLSLIHIFFRFISNLERLGFHSRVYLYMSPNFQDNASIRKFLKEYFPLLVPEVEVYCDVSQMKFAHATVATSWTTAYYVRKFQNTISKFYFVQDFEPHFYAHGSEYEFAENTYKMGFRGITAVSYTHLWHPLYFWAFVLMAGLISSKVFTRLRVHFSDVL